MFWPSKQADKTKAVATEAHESKFWNRVANITTNHSWIISIVVILVLAVPYYPYFKMSTSYDTLAELSDNSNSVKGFQILSEHFDIGNMMPSTLVLTGSSGSATSSGALMEIEEINTRLLQIDGVASVLSVVSPYGTGEPMQALKVVGQISILLEQLNNAIAGAVSNPAALFGAETAQMFQLLGAYLAELGTAFPEVTAEPSYISAVTVLNDMSTALASVDLENIDMAAMANLQMAFQQYISECAGIDGVGGYFSAQGNPYFIPQSLLALYPELEQLISTFISEDAEAVRLIINLSDYPYSEAAIDTTEQIGMIIHNETDSQYFNIEGCSGWGYFRHTGCPFHTGIGLPEDYDCGACRCLFGIMPAASKHRSPVFHNGPGYTYLRRHYGYFILAVYRYTGAGRCQLYCSDCGLCFDDCPWRGLQYFPDVPYSRGSPG